MNGKVSASVEVASGVLEGSVLEPLLLILCTSKLFHIVGNSVVGYSDVTTIYAVIPRPHSRPRATELLNLKLAAINSRCLKWHMRLIPKKMKSMVVSRSRTIASGYGDLHLSGAELEGTRSLRILGVTLDSKLTFETHSREVVSKAAGSLGVGSCAKQKSYLIVYVRSRAVSMHMFVQPRVLCPRVDVVGRVSFGFAA